MLALAALALGVVAQSAPDDGSWGKELPGNILSQAITPDDYPIESLKRGEVGDVKFGVVVGADGLVKSCSILRSSGSQRLDTQTCRIMQARLRFKPAHDSQGSPVEDRFSGDINWVLNPRW